MKYDLSKLELCEDLIYYRGLGYTQEEISQEVGIPRRTVGKKLEELNEKGIKGDN